MSTLKVTVLVLFILLANYYALTIAVKHDKELHNECKRFDKHSVSNAGQRARSDKHKP